MDGQLVNIGYNNTITAEQLTGIFDFKMLAIKRIIQQARDEKPRSVIDLTGKRKAKSVLILTGDRYIISSLPMIQLANRFGLIKPGECTDKPLPQ